MRLSFLYGTPVRRLQREINAAEFAELAAFLALEPQGPMRLDFWMVRVLSWLAALCGQRSRPVDFLPEWWGVKRMGQATTGAEMAALFEVFASVQNGSAGR